VLPVLLDSFRLNLVGKYLTYAFVAVGLVLCWGYTGILSLGQGHRASPYTSAWLATVRITYRTADFPLPIDLLVQPNTKRRSS
jgi:ABC-type branched-subunit amino acid transport system permease subunit